MITLVFYSYSVVGWLVGWLVGRYQVYQSSSSSSFYIGNCLFAQRDLTTFNIKNIFMKKKMAIFVLVSDKFPSLISH
ncbi:hypothetical protein DERF_007815 [Dermatophagoides farinae]|uniref:Uncharacterized protein n=1 Tax=Dermatophagoides farinae TaxID=6954 RepID=A0A922HYP5_DERFA|nr:hypothetical protein DERF_007815 [Dermatophagoides farinae]